MERSRVASLRMLWDQSCLLARSKLFSYYARRISYISRAVSWEIKLVIAPARTKCARGSRTGQSQLLLLRGGAHIPIASRKSARSH